MEQTFSRLRVVWIQFRPLLRFQPVSGHLWLDTCLLLLVGTLQHTVLPFLARGTLPIDMMTPWLVTTLVRETLPRGLFLAAVAALILETHSAAPAGLYLCAYWVIAVVINITRGTLSWRHALPWALTFAGSQLWVILFATFVLAVNNGGIPFDWNYVWVQSGRLLIGVGLGMIFCRHYLAIGLKGEDG